MPESPDRFASTDLYRDLFALQSRVRFVRVRRPSVLTNPEGSIRIALLRAGAAWLISWASLLAMLNWGLS